MLSTKRQVDTNVGSESGACCSPTGQGDQKKRREGFLMDWSELQKGRVAPVHCE